MNAREMVRREVEAIFPLDAQEQADIQDTLSWIDSGAPLFRTAKPATPPRHLVSYVLLMDRDHLLLVDHRDAGLWLPTGGHVEPGESPRNAARREAQEELGIDGGVPAGPLFLTVTGTVGRSAGHTDVSLWYLLRWDRAAPLCHDPEEFRGLAWFHRDRVPLERSDPQMGRFLAKLER